MSFSELTQNKVVFHNETPLEKLVYLPIITSARNGLCLDKLGGNFSIIEYHIFRETSVDVIICVRSDGCPTNVRIPKPIVFLGIRTNF